jgi:TetR/AcrR family transcriptional regulator
MPQQAKSRREFEEDARCRHILNTAERLFSEKGLIDTSVSDIAKASEFGVGTLYKYFKDKNTLIQTLLDDRLSAHFDEMEQVLHGDGTPAEIIDNLIACQLNSIQKRRLFFVVYFTHFHPGTIDGYAGYTGGLNHETMQKRKKELLKSMQAVFDRGIRIGQFARINSRILSAALFGIFISISFLDGRNTSPTWNVEEMRADLNQILFDRVLLSNDKK